MGQTLSYDKRLSAATTEAEVVAVVRDYVSGWYPSELARLPANCLPGRIRDVEDIADRAIALTRWRMDCLGAPDGPALEMETIFAHACARISALDGSRPQRGEHSAYPGDR